MRPRTCSRSGVYRNASEGTPGPLRSRMHHRDREQREVHVPESTNERHPLKSRKNHQACLYSLLHAPNPGVVHKRQVVLPKDCAIDLPLQQLRITKECHHILRWFLDGKGRLQRPEHLQSELRRGEASGYREHIGKDWW